MVLTVTVSVPGVDAIGGAGTKDVDISITETLAPGQTLVIPMSLASQAPGEQILSWRFKATIADLPVFAFETKTGVAPDPTLPPPPLTASYLTGEMPILGFASPATLVGTVQIVNDIFYGSCPSIPPPESGWKNHGQYVRCIAQRAEDLVSTVQITQDEADAAVSAAAQSETGKK